MSNQSAVEWLYERLERMIPRTISYDIDKRQYLEQAKEMEKEQIIDAHLHGMDFIPVDPNYKGDAEQYYNETYKKEEK
jgi:hypothetical protein